MTKEKNEKWEAWWISINLVELVKKVIKKNNLCQFQ